MSKERKLKEYDVIWYHDNEIIERHCLVVAYDPNEAEYIFWQYAKNKKWGCSIVREVKATRKKWNRTETMEEYYFKELELMEKFIKFHIHTLGGIDYGGE